MHVDKIDLSEPLEADPRIGLSRRDFITQVGIAGIAGFAMSPSLAPAQPVSPSSAERMEDAHPTGRHNVTQGNHAMPLVRIDAFEGRSEAEVKTLLDAAHVAIVKAFHINERDRYQIYHAHAKSHFIMQDTGLGIVRTEKALIITVYSKGRAEILKRRLYQQMTEELSRAASIAPSDVMMCVVENSAADWTFGNGDPQFLTGELG